MRLFLQKTITTAEFHFSEPEIVPPWIVSEDTFQCEEVISILKGKLKLAQQTLVVVVSQ